MAITVRSRGPATHGSFVEFRCLLRRLTHFGVVRVEDIRALRIPHQANLLIYLVHAHGAPRARDGGEQVLVEVFFEIHHVTREDDGASLGQSDHRELTPRGVTRRADNLDALVAKQVEVTIETDDVVLLTLGKIPRNVVN